MIEYCPETDIEFDAPRFTSADKLRGAECFCTRATLDDLLSDGVRAPVLRSAGLRAGRISRDDDGDGLEPGHALIGRAAMARRRSGTV